MTWPPPTARAHHYRHIGGPLHNQVRETYGIYVEVSGHPNHRYEFQRDKRTGEITLWWVKR